MKSNQMTCSRRPSLPSDLTSAVKPRITPVSRWILSFAVLVLAAAALHAVRSGTTAAADNGRADHEHPDRRT